MTYGIQLINDSGGLTLSDQAITFKFIGRATLNFIQQPTTVLNSSVYKSTAGYQSYSIVWPEAILPILPLTTLGGVKLLSVTRSGDTWTIIIHNSSGTYNGEGMAIETATEVFVFGAPLSTPGGQWGAALYNNSGKLVADLTARPLTFIRKISGATVDIPLSGIIKPGILGDALLAKRVTIGSSPPSGPPPGPGIRTWRMLSSFKISGGYGSIEYYPSTCSRSTSGYGSSFDGADGGGYGGTIMAVELNGL